MNGTCHSSSAVYGAHPFIGCNQNSHVGLSYIFNCDAANRARSGKIYTTGECVADHVATPKVPARLQGLSTTQRTTGPLYF